MHDTETTDFIAKLRQSIRGLKPECRKLFYACMCTPWDLDPVVMKDIFRTMRLTAENGARLLEKLASLKLLDPTLVRVCTTNETSYWWPRENRLALYPWTAAALEMQPEDMVLSEFLPAYERCDGRVRELLAEADYRWLLMRLASKDPASEVRPPEAAEETPDRLWYRWDDAIEEFLFYEEMGPFLSTLSERRANQLMNEVWRHHAGGLAWRDVEAVSRNFGLMALAESGRRRVTDWKAFMRFWHEGHIKERLSEMTSESPHYWLLKALEAVAAGNAVEAGKAAKKAVKARCFDRKHLLGCWENLACGIALLADRLTPTTQRTLGAVVKSAEKLEPDALVLLPIAEHGTRTNGWIEYYTVRRLFDAAPLSAVMVRLCLDAFNVDEFHQCMPNPGKSLRNPVFADYPVLAQIEEAVKDPTSEKAAALEASLAMKPLLTRERIVDAWEADLRELLDYAVLNSKKTEKAAKGEGGSRVAYLLNTTTWEVQPRQQKSTNGVTWSAGRDVVMSAFVGKNVEGMTKHDMLIADAAEDVGRGRSHSYRLRGAAAMVALIGHPLVFNAKGDQRIDIVKVDPQLTVTHTKEGFEVSTNIEEKYCLDSPAKHVTCMVRSVQDDRIEVTEVTDDCSMVMRTLEKTGSTLPDAAKPILTEILERLSVRMPVRSELLKHSAVVQKTKGDSGITLQISPDDDNGYAVRAVVRPIAGATVACEPGKGLEYLAVSVGGKSVQTERNLKKEQENFDALVAKVAFLDDCRIDDDRWSLSTEGCLSLLSAVYGDKSVTVEWPEGVKMKVTHAPIAYSSLSLSVNRIGTWFEVKGEAALDGKTKLKIAELLRLVREAKGNFIALGENEYVALTESLKKQLAMLDKLAGGAKTPQLSVFNAGVLGEFEKNGAEITADKDYRDLLARIEKAGSVTAATPETLMAELRDYQTDGFEWMMRLASWGAGAVLADDMGLGKTVQTIAVLLARAAEGPQLVVVPASVLYNWRDELARFAPSLKQAILNQAGDRAKTLEKAGAGTVVLTTYGVLTSEVEAMAEKTWATAVFDEAHNVKNKETKAFKAASAVKADFRVMLTGTPLQNHLAEIWALFEVAVPGLLGSFNRFSERFVLPIERDKDREQQRLLKRIVSPFILRRTKTDVLNELPEKTEMTVKVALSKEERALYEELREETQQNLEAGEINPVQALAQLLKLRQAACSAELIDPKLAIPSSKTAAFLELVDDLIENRHRALVFSQFTSHLALIRRALDEKGVKYLYLDGSMPPSQRQKLVETFEEGTMPLFLISLKAGGTGLNLTAADYVIHMDPWWNPAIEDQASDRAYRIGQERPVTIYRLIAEGTVEEKILKLHGTKKSLADALLEGTEMSSRLGRDEILELLALAQ